MGKQSSDFHGGGFFDWQFSAPTEEQRKEWAELYKYDEEKYWGGFSREPFDLASYKFPAWAIGGFVKHGAPVLSPTPGSWDCGRFGGGVHNGSVIKKDGKLYYIYRGEFPVPEEYAVPGIDYMCDIGIAESEDGINFRKLDEFSPLFRKGEDARFSFEDVCVVSFRGKYYMYLNRWNWKRFDDPSECGVCMAVSDDLFHWEMLGLVFPDAKRIHRNPVVVQDPDNEAVMINGKFVMYINDGLMGLSDDLIHWESVELEESWPGGEGCFALTNYNPQHTDDIILFTGGHHTGHFYAVGEILFNKRDPGKPIEWLPRPVLTADENIPWENGLSAEPPHKPVSYWRDTIFFTGMTLYNGEWRAYYGGSEFYTCLASSKDVKPAPPGANIETLVKPIE
jgi:predicted GH43/DUF377 family glycosyl hydrolase